MFKVVAFAIITLILVLLLKHRLPEYSMLILAAAGVILTLTVLGWVYSPLQTLFESLSRYNLDSALFKYLLKVFGVLYITKFATELCEDFGQTLLSGKIDFAGRATVFLLSLPLINSVFDLVSEML